ncbi:MAG: DUF58 domain-containing protein [Actinomycetota bacterium]
MPTRRGLALLLGAVAALAAGRVLGIGELYAVAVAAVALVALATASVQLATAAVAARRRVAPERLEPDEPFEVAIDLRNDGRLPLGTLLAEDACPPALATLRSGVAAAPRALLSGLPPRATRTASYEALPPGRGRWRIGPLSIAVRDPFGLAEQRRRYEATSTVLVWPRLVDLPSGRLPGTSLGGGAAERRRLLDVGDEFHTMREYHPGDDLRRVHWPSTARRAKLMVRQHEQPWAAQATVVLDTRARQGGPPGRAAFERGVSAAASACVHLERRGYEVRLVLQDDRDLRPAARVEAHLERLAEVEPSHADRLAATLDGLRRGLATGLVVAVLAPPRDGGALSDAPDVMALLRTGRSLPGAVALVATDPSGEAADRAEDLVALLRLARWRAGSLADGVAEGWRQALTAPRRRRVAT